MSNKKKLNSFPHTHFVGIFRVSASLNIIRATEYSPNHTSKLMKNYIMQFNRLKRSITKQRTLHAQISRRCVPINFQEMKLHD